MKKITGIIAVLIVSVSLVLGSFLTAEAKDMNIKLDQNMKLIDAFEGGRLFLAGGMKIVQLNGGFKQMGRQYGMLLKGDINAVYDLMVNRILIGEKKIKYDEIVATSKVREMDPPEYVKEMIAGMAETTGLTYDQANIVRLNLIYMATMCSAAAAYSDYSKDGNVVFGRNLDLGKGPMTLLKPFTVIVVYNPLGTQKNSVAEITYAGCIYAQTLFNKSGMMLEMNNGMISRMPVANENVPNDPLAYKMYDLMFDSFNMEEVITGIRNIKINCGMMLNVADKTSAYCCEMSPEGIFVRSGDEPGFLAVSNHFLNPGWKSQIKLGKGKKYGKTLERHSNLMKQAGKHKGEFDAERMMATFDRTIPNGGPTFPTRRSEDLQTLYSCVFTPADMKLFVKNRETTNWVEVRLGELFLPRGK